MSAETAKAKRLASWKLIRSLRDQKRKAKTADAKTKIKVAYRRALEELTAARAALNGGSKKTKVGAAKKAQKGKAKVAA